jgi:hypothetical protein
MSSDHEVVRLFKEHVFPLSNKLTEMLNEHYSHQTERRGCGYTQATRVLAEYINFPRDSIEATDLKIFQDYDFKKLKKIIEQKNIYNLEIEDWHNLDQNHSIQDFLVQAKPEKNDDFKALVEQEVETQIKLRKLSQQAELEESRVICCMLEDVILPKTADETGYVEIKTLSGKPKVGSCPMAENFFLKIAHRSMLRQGSINIFVDQQNRPLLIEKMNMGDDHSCINLQPLIMNGIRIPVGSLFSVEYDIEQITNKVPNQEFKGYIIPYTEIPGFWFLRLTTLAISPENRKRAFTTHFEQQVNNGLFSPDITLVTQLQDVAMSQLRVPSLG